MYRGSPAVGVPRRAGRPCTSAGSLRQRVADLRGQYCQRHRAPRSSWPAAISPRYRRCGSSSSWPRVSWQPLRVCCSATSSRRWVTPSPRARTSDLDDGRHDHRLAAVGLPHPLADRATDRLRDPGRGRRRSGPPAIPAPPRPLRSSGLQRLGVFGEAPRMQLRRGRRLPGAAAAPRPSPRRNPMTG